MARKLSQNTINKFKKRLEAEREQLLSMLEQHQEEREKVRLSEASAERSPDPTSADGGSMAFAHLPIFLVIFSQFSVFVWT